uniref:Antitoxin Xre/MbcA/ParS-like toxin-binding domain-containing protein n=1 Tax=Burkholderia sp. (strain CCGE1003) TaxID=640512 RepID=E1TI48_BURSG
MAVRPIVNLKINFCWSVALTDDPVHDAAAEAATRFREELLGRGWPDACRVAELAGLSPEQEGAAQVTENRRTGALLGVWSAPEHRFVYPDFQFNRSGALRTHVAELLGVLPANKDDQGGWRRAFWLYSPHSLLEGQTPADVFANASIRVIEVAREEFLGDPDAAW